ncbi:LicD family protein [Kangiella shandongensis]|uniref:LicD family protein n=1 Tax=Kangiella shandongensis TaxID=2763258 RepID=UPI001CBCC484|nr:LicD family protein [Kangiella shandongensis]
MVKELIEPLIMNPTKRAVYYRFTHVVLKLLEKHNIEYFAHSGTLLGIARHNGFIPWDDDVDVMVPEDFEENLEAFLADIENYGLKLGTSKTFESGLIQLVPNSDMIFDNGYPYFMGFDIFIGVREEIKGFDCYFYKSKDFRRWFKKNWFPYEEIYPLQEYKFGPLKMMGPKKFDRYFKNSGFKLDEAIIKVHNATKELAKDIVSDLEDKKLYPITDKAVLNMEAPYDDIILHDLEYYRVKSTSSGTGGLLDKLRLYLKKTFGKQSSL